MDAIIKTVLDNGGSIAGGFVREWVRFGEPQNKGWNDVDVFCVKETNKQAIEAKLRELGVAVDFRAQPPFNDYYCNCWMFDGEIKPVEATNRKFSVEEIKEQTINSQAKPIGGAAFRIDKIISFFKNGWDVYFLNGKLATKEKIIQLAKNPIIGTTNLNRVEI